MTKCVERDVGEATSVHDGELCERGSYANIVRKDSVVDGKVLPVAALAAKHELFEACGSFENQSEYAMIAHVFVAISSVLGIVLVTVLTVAYPEGRERGEYVTSATARPCALCQRLVEYSGVNFNR